jgi:hypothetical protein
VENGEDEEAASHQRSQHSEELLEVDVIVRTAGRRQRERVYFQELRRSTLEAATTRHSNRVTGVRRSNRRRGVALEEEEKEEEGYVEWVTKTLTTLLHKSPHRIPLKSLWRALNVDGGAYATQQNNFSPL